MPDDGNRYDVIDGVLIVSPATVWEHQEMGFAAGILLRNACPRDMRLFAVTAVPARLLDGLRP
jgi:Uma2 family endonuclease